MKKVDYERAKAGEPVVTQNGEPVKILCLREDLEDCPLVVIVDSIAVGCITHESEFLYCGDVIGFGLFMKPKFKPKPVYGWVNIYQYDYTINPNEYFAITIGKGVHKTKKKAKANKAYLEKYIKTVKIKLPEDTV